MAPSIIRVGIVGLGFGRSVHLPAFRTHPNCEVEVICGQSLDRAASVAAEHGIPRGLCAWQELVESADVDLISIAVPAAQQAPIVLAALRAGKPVFCEKPIAATLEDAAALRALASRTRVPNSVDFEFPELTSFRSARELLRVGALGQLRHVAVHWNVETRMFRAHVDSWKAHPGQGGGTLNLFASHVLHYVEWLFGSIATVRAGLGCLPGRGDDSLAVLCLELESGPLVSVSISSHAFLGSGHRIEAYGSDGTWLLENRDPDYARGFRLTLGTRARNAFELVASEPQADVQVDGRIAPVSRLTGRLLAAVRGAPPEPPSLEQGYRVQQLLDAARESDLTGRKIVLVP